MLYIVHGGHKESGMTKLLTQYMYTFHSYSIIIVIGLQVSKHR